MKSLFPLLFTGALIIGGCVVRSNPEWVAPYIGSMMGKLCGWETDDNPWTNRNYYSEYHNLNPKADMLRIRANMQAPPALNVPRSPASNPYTN